MAERSNAAVLKTVDSKGPGVRIPLSPPKLKALDTSAFSFINIINNRPGALSIIMKQIAFCILSLIFVLQVNAQDNEPVDSLGSQKHMLVFPFVIRTLETSWGFGGVGAFFFRPDKKDSLTRTSDFNVLALYTLRKQLIVVGNATIFFPHENQIIRFQTSYSYYPDNFWGLGNYTPDSAKENFSQKQYLINPQFLQRVYKKLYTGVVYQYQHTGDVTYTPGGIFDKENITARYGGHTSGFGLLLTWDSRNEAYSPTKGFFAEARYIAFDKAFGSRFNFNQLSIDCRKYVQLHTSSVLAFQAIAGLSGGEVPFRDLQELGGPDIMRGLYGGRFTDKCLVAGQTEFRQHLFWRLGVVAFGALGQVAHHPGGFALNGFHYTGGGGVRIALSQKEKLNLRVDYGIGKNSNALTLELREAF